MKKLIFILFGLLLYSSSFAQPYKSYFGEEYTKWYVRDDGWDFCTFTTVYSSYDGHTEEIDGVIYQRIFIDSDLTGTSVVYLREDISTGRLFLRQLKNSPEIIISDMSLEEGDLIYLGDDCFFDLGDNCFDFWGFNNLIFADNKIYALVDDVYYLNGLKHVRTSAMFSNIYKAPTGFSSNDTLMFIESIGSNIGPMSMISRQSVVGDPVLKLICYEIENNLVHLTLDENCFISSCWNSVNDLTKYPEVKVEIKDGFLSLFFETPFSGQIKLLHYSGKRLYQKTLSNETIFTVNINEFPKGVYILQVESLNKGIINKKIVIM